MPAFRPHQTATSDGPWDGPANKVRVRSGEDRTYYGKIYAWYDPEGDEGVKETYKFIHHEVGEDGRPGPANLTACSTGIGVLNGGRGGTTIPAADRKGVWKHLAKHLKDAGKEAPPLKSEEEQEQPLWLRSLQDTPWALLPAKLEEIQLFVERYLREDKPLAAALSERGRRREPEGYQVVDGVAVLQVYGMLGKRMNLLMDFSGGTSTEILAQQLRQALDDPKVGAVLLDIESPGGSVDGVKEVADLIYSSRQTKPIVAFANDLMASGAYWLGSAADRVVATETGFVGAIGVAMMHYDYSGRDAQQGVKRTAIYAGKYKRIASDEKPLSEEGAAYLQGLVDYLYGVFLEAVGRHRGVSPETVHLRMADGRLFVGRQALEAGLVDALGTFEAALALARKLGGERKMDLKLFKEKHAEIYEAARREVTVGEAAQWDLEGAEALRAEGREAERARVVEIITAQGPEAIKLQAVAEGWEPKAAFKAMLEHQETEKAKALAELAQAAPPPVGQEVERVTVQGGDLPLEKRALQEWESQPQLAQEFGQFETYLAFRRAEEAGLAKVKK